MVLSVPINLRQYYESATARNFFSTMNISYQFNNSSPDFEEIIQSVSESFKKGLTKEQLDKQLNHFYVLRKKIYFYKGDSLPIRDYVLRIANRLNDRKITSSISNIGKIIMPSEFNNYIRQFSIWRQC